MSLFSGFKHHFVPSPHNAYQPHLLRRGWLGFLLAVVLASEGFLVANLLARQSTQNFLANVVSSEIVLLTNVQRAQQDAPPLAYNTRLAAAAQAKATDMAARGYFAHNGPDGKTPWQWVSEAGYDYRYAGENLAVRFLDSKDVVDAWMASPSHRSNIVKPAYREIGVGVAQGTFQGQPATFVVQYFGAPSAVSPVAANAGAVAQSQATFFNSLDRLFVKFFGEPRASTAWSLGSVTALLGLAMLFTVFRHMHIQPLHLLAPGAAVAGLAITLLVLNGSLLNGSLTTEQAASVILKGAPSDFGVIGEGAMLIP